MARTRVQIGRESEASEACIPAVAATVDANLVFEGDALLSSMITFAEQTDEVPDGGAVTFSANLFGDPCPTFVVGVSGYFS